MKSRATQDAKAEEQLPNLHLVNEDFFAKFNAARIINVVFQQAARPFLINQYNHMMHRAVYIIAALLMQHIKWRDLFCRLNLSAQSIAFWPKRTSQFLTGRCSQNQYSAIHQQIISGTKTPNQYAIKFKEALKNLSYEAQAKIICIQKHKSHCVTQNFWAGFNTASLNKVKYQPAVKAAQLIFLLTPVYLTGCHRQTATEFPEINFSACTAPKGHTPIPESGCAFISVPENPAEPTGATIDVHFLRIKAVNARPQADPLVLIQGGPGGSSQMMAYTLHRYFASVRQNRDLLFVDLRGTGESHPLNCQGLEGITSQLSDKDALHTYRTLMNECAQKYAQRAPYYSTELAAADLNTIRQRLGYSQFNLWGASYGTRVALKFAVNYPAFTRSLVLDGLAPNIIALPRHIARDATAAFNRLNEYCQNDALCKQHYGDLTLNAETIARHLQQAEHNLQPEQISLPDPLNQKPKEWIFTPRRFAQLLISALYSRELTSLVPRALKEAADGNYQLLGTLSALAEANNEQLAIAEGLYYSIICNEDLTHPTATPPPSPVFMGVDLVEDKLAVCANWPKTAPSAQNLAPNKQINTIPTLLLSGALDPVTPKAWADLVALLQLNHQIIEVPGGNHVVSTLGCIPNLIAQFINTPEVRLPTDCSQAIAPLPFYLGADPAAQEPPQEANGGQHD